MTPTMQEARLLMKHLQASHVEAAIARIDAGEKGEFAESTKYDLVYNLKRYAPKRVVGLALNELSGAMFTNQHFKGGEESLCFRTLARLKFDVCDKLDAPYSDGRGKYGKLSREWVLEAVQAHATGATPGQVRDYILARVPLYQATNVDPDLRLLCVNSWGRSAWPSNRQPRRCDQGNELDALFHAEGKYFLYEPAKHGVWELAWLAGEKVVRPRLAVLPIEEEDRLRAISLAHKAKDFDPEDEVDARTKMLRSIAVRRGQPAFRQAVLVAYGRRCAVTGCDIEEALEAAHIVPYKGAHTNAVKNGLLLRADMHTLFDLGLFRIDPATFTVVMSPQLKASSYAQYDGARLTLPQLKPLHPSAQALAMHGARSNVDVDRTALVSKD
jgi:hypothetical protein